VEVEVVEEEAAGLLLEGAVVPFMRRFISKKKINFWTFTLDVYLNPKSLNHKPQTLFLVTL
jgi:hypothetical protein